MAGWPWFPFLQDPFRRLALTCVRTWYAPCNSLSEWVSIHVPAGTTDRLKVAPSPGGASGTALRVEVRDGDFAVNPFNGQPIPGGWRAEGVGPTEVDGSWSRYEWATWFDSQYPLNPIGPDGKLIWQVFAQWHQSDADAGSSPPIGFVLVGHDIRLQLYSIDAANPTVSVLAQELNISTLKPGSWHRFRVDVRWSLTDGEVVVVHNRKRIGEFSGVSTLFPRTSQLAEAGTTYLKMGLYRKAVPAGQGFVLYHDEIARCELSWRWASFIRRLKP